MLALAKGPNRLGVLTSNTGQSPAARLFLVGLVFGHEDGYGTLLRKSADVWSLRRCSYVPANGIIYVVTY
jgi:hypothetical protein